MKELFIHRIKGLCFAGLLALCLPLYAQQGESPFSVYISSDRLTFSEHEPILLSAIIKNVSGRTSSFKVYDVNYTSFQPVVYGMDGREAETIVPYRLMNRTTQDTVQYIEPRTSVIGADEKINKKLDITSFYRLEPGKEYRVKIFFLPDARTPQIIASENSLVIKIVPSERDENEDIQPPQRYQGSITPTETIMLALTAEKTKRWQNMLKFITLDKFVAAYPDYAQAYNSGSTPIRKKVLRDFAAFLSTPRTDYIVDFDVKSESILDDKKTAFVDARVIRNASPKPFVYVYRYTLEMANGSWFISGIEATVSKERIISR